MQIRITHAAANAVLRRTARGDRILRSVIVVGGMSVLLMLAWAHLGLGALLVPPSGVPAQMSVTAGADVVSMSAGAGQLVAGNDNAVTLRVLDRAGHPVTNATVRVHADMTTMAMPVPDVTASAQAGGRYAARLLFTMAGPWRLTITVLSPGHAAVQAAFDVGVRWR